jgi:hypothetical protein
VVLRLAPALVVPLLALAVALLLGGALVARRRARPAPFDLDGIGDDDLAG